MRLESCASSDPAFHGQFEYTHCFRTQFICNGKLRQDNFWKINAIRPCSPSLLLNLFLTGDLPSNQRCVRSSSNHIYTSTSLLYSWHICSHVLQQKVIIQGAFPNRVLVAFCSNYKSFDMTLLLWSFWQPLIKSHNALVGSFLVKNKHS